MNLSSMQKLSFDLHNHTTFSDGKNTPEEMVVSAIEKGLDAIGFSDHSYTFFDESYCMKKDRIKDYTEEISKLKEKYSGKIKILCGIEQDFYSNEPTDIYDYVICSVHYLKADNTYFATDDGVGILLEARDKYFNGDIYSLIEEYFKTEEKIANTNADIVGHFDYIKLYNDDSSLFDEKHPRYINAWKKAADKLIENKKIFEINIGGITRKYKTEAYPSKEICDYIVSKGGKLICSSDSHSVLHQKKFEIYSE